MRLLLSQIPPKTIESNSPDAMWQELQRRSRWKNRVLNFVILVSVLIAIFVILAGLYIVLM